MRKLSILFLVAIAAMAGGCHNFDDLLLDPPDGNGGQVDSRDIPFETIIGGPGYSSGMHTREQVVVTSQAQWQDVWDRVHQGILPKPAAPDIDFNTSTVVALFQGLHGTGGFEIEVKQVTESDNDVTVSFVDIVPGQDCFVTQALTSPFHIIRIDRQSKPIGFAGERVVRVCN